MESCGWRSTAKTGGKKVVLPVFSALEWMQNLWKMHQSCMKLCGLVEGFMAPDEVTFWSPISCIMRVAIVSCRLGRTLCRRPSSLQQSVAPFTSCNFFLLFGLWKGLNDLSATDWNFIQFEPVSPEWGVYYEAFACVLGFETCYNPNIRLRVHPVKVLSVKAGASSH